MPAGFYGVWARGLTRVNLDSYLPVLLFILVGLVIGAAPMALGALLGPHKPDPRQGNRSGITATDRPGQTANPRTAALGCDCGRIGRCDKAAGTSARDGSCRKQPQWTAVLLATG